MPRPLAAGEAVAFVTIVDRSYAIEPHQNLESEQASMRLRVGIPARELARSAKTWLVPLDYFARDPDLQALGAVGALVIGKLPVSFFTGQAAAAGRLLEAIESAARKRRVIVDFSDDLAAAAKMYSAPALADIQRRLLRACRATVPTAALRERLARDARHAVSVIEDPFEAPAAGAPRFAPGDTLRLAWFGVFGPPLKPFLEGAFGSIARKLAPRPIELAFVTYAGQQALVHELARALRAIHPDFTVRHIAWSPAATAAALADADLVVLPQDAASDWGRVKSHNRLVESIRAGRFTVASPVPAYVELDAYAWIGDDLAAGVEWAVSHPDEVRARVTAGQGAIELRFAPAVIAARWAQVLGVSQAADAPR